MLMVGELGAKLSLYGKQQFDRDLDDSGRRFVGLGSTTSTVGKGIATSLKVASTATAVVAAAVGALTLGTLKTGLAYNALQQTSRAALRTLTGGAEQANAQMDKLDAFARTSPFAKSVFISAQQQLLGFGVEAQKVIPILDAVQNATAAVGGSNDDIAGLVSIFAKIQSSAKITAEDLNMFGNRGVDAAGIIGEAMGKTGADIRKEITEGSLDALVALDALTKGMQDKFGGASANVKQTIAGTVDRIKAATREIGAAMAEPFVSQQGGGLFVTWGNQVADVLQGIRAKSGPVVQFVTTQLQPAFVKITEALDKAQVHVKAFDVSTLERGLGKVASYGPGIAGVGAAFVAMGTNIPVLSKLGLAVNPLAAGLLAVAATSPEIRAAGRDLLTSLKPLLPVAEDLAKVGIRALNSALPVAADGIRLVANVTTPLVRALAAVPAPVLAGVAAFVALKGSVGAPLTNALQRAGDEMVLQRALAGQMAVSYQTAGATVGATAGTITGQMTNMSAAMAVARSKISGVGLALKAAFLNPVGIALMVAGTALGLWAAENDAAQTKVQEHSEAVAELRGTLDEVSGATTEATRQLVAKQLVEDGSADKLKKLGVSTLMYTDAMVGNASAGDKVRKSLQAIMSEQAKSVTSTEQATKFADELGISSEVLSAALLGNADANAELNAAFVNSKMGSAEFATALGILKRDVEALDPDTKNLIANLEEHEEKLAAAKREQELYNEAMRQAAAKMTDAARSNARLNEALKIAREVSLDATTRLNALKQALDELRGGAQSQAEATRDLNEQILNLGDAFAQTDENGNKLATSLVTVSGGIDTTTRAGQALFDQVSRLNDQMLTAQQLAYDNAITTGKTLPEAYQAAMDAAAPYQKALADAGATAGLSDKQIAGMTGTLLAIPAVTAYLVTDNGEVDAQKQKVLQLTATIFATPDKTIEVDAPTIAPIKKQLLDMGMTVTELPNGKVKVSATGIASVEAAISRLVRPRTIQITQHVSGSLKGGYANGAVIAYENGGVATPNPWRAAAVQAFDNGGFPSGVYKGGRPIYKFAEEGVPWETFLSGKPSARTRNQNLLLKTAQLLGMQPMDFSSLPGDRKPRAFAEGDIVSSMPLPGDAPGRQINITIPIHNPVVRDLIDDVRSARDIAGTLIAGL